jgi:hypothetical protein
MSSLTHTNCSILFLKFKKKSFLFGTNEKSHCKDGGRKKHNPLSDIFKGGFYGGGNGIIIIIIIILSWMGNHCLSEQMMGDGCGKKDASQTRSVSSHCGLAIYIKKYFKGKRRIMETQIFHHAKI